MGARPLMRACRLRPRRSGRALRVLAGGSLAAVGVLVTTGAAGATPAATHKPFVNGNVTAVSQAMQIAPKTGGFAYTITVGTSIADYRDTLAQASSQSLNMGLIGTSLTTQQCNGDAPPLKPDQLPQPLVAESDHGSQKRTATAGPASSSGVLAASGRESVAATNQPSATASFDGGTFTVPGLLSVGGFASSGRALLVGHTREAVSSSEVHHLDLAGGKVVFDDMTWSATQRTGGATGSTGSFHVGGLTVAGKQQQPSAGNLAAAAAAANKALAFSGLHVTLPAVTKHGSAVTVSPLSIGVDDSRAGAKLVAPVLDAAQPVTDAVTQALLGIDCRTGNVLTVADIGLGTADGTGNTDLLFGGASVGTQLIAASNPFGSPSLGSNPGTPLASAPGSGKALGGSSLGGSAAGGVARAGGSPLPGSGRSATAGQQPVVAQPAGQVSTSCSTTSSAGWPSCSHGNALGVGLIALGVLAVMGGGDYLALRRRRLPEISL